MNDLHAPDSIRQILSGSNLYLVGMMGSGKTRTGPPLAKQLSYGFVDLDVVVEKLARKSIPRIFEEDGEIAFREIEKQVLNNIGQHHSLVVATGGGVVTNFENWGILHHGIVIWIDPGPDRLWQRLQLDEVKRPLLTKNNSLEAFEKLLTERNSFYKEADLHVTVEEESPEEVASKILEKLPSIISS